MPCHGRAGKRITPIKLGSHIIVTIVRLLHDLCVYMRTRVKIDSETTSTTQERRLPRSLRSLRPPCTHNHTKIAWLKLVSCDYRTIFVFIWEPGFKQRMAVRVFGQVRGRTKQGAGGLTRGHKDEPRRKDQQRVIRQMWWRGTNWLEGSIVQSAVARYLVLHSQKNSSISINEECITGDNHFLTHLPKSLQFVSVTFPDIGSEKKSLFFIDSTSTKGSFQNTR